jgi:nondiscriminating glutamyl-tRNA synthetase
LPLLLNPDKSKLSKRQGDVAVSDYRKKGFLPEAVMNYIALLGWNPGDDREFFKKQELIDNFKLERVNKSGSVFDINKLKWMNGNYIRKLRKTKFGVIINNIKKYLLEAKVIDENFSEKKLELLADMYYEKLNVFSDIIELSSELFNNKFEEFNGNVKNIVQKKEFESVKQIFVDEINNFDKLNSNNLNILVKKIQNNTGVKGHKLYTILRILVSGKDEGPDLLKLFLFLGKDNIVERLKNFDQKN